MPKMTNSILKNVTIHLKRVCQIYAINDGEILYT